MEIYENEGCCLRMLRNYQKYFLDAIWSLQDISCVRDIRGIGLMAGVEVWPEEGKPGVRGGEITKENVLEWLSC